MTATQLIQLRVVLLALIPTYGRAAGVAQLTEATQATARAVHEALEEPLQGGEVRYELMSETYAVVKQGGIL